jgi:hypothetical protein
MVKATLGAAFLFCFFLLDWGDLLDQRAHGFKE